MRTRINPNQSNGAWWNNGFVLLLPMPLALVLLLRSVSGFGLTSRSARFCQRGIQWTPHHLAASSTDRAAMMSRVDDVDVVSNVAESVKVWTLDDKELSLDEILRQDGSSPIILSCLSHFGDFNAWELTQQYAAALKPGGKFTKSNARVVLVGIGSVASAQKFAQDLDLNSLTDRLTLVADPEGSVTEALGCYKGWLAVDTEHRQRYPQADISPYIKLLGMIFGFGSPGTITQVLYGYLGDTSGRNGVDGRTWVVDGLLQGSSKGRFPTLTVEAFKDTPATSNLRPFELATLRLQTGLHIVLNWGSLGPKNSGDLFTRMGATFVLDGDLKCRWSYFDQGILTYADLDEVQKVIQEVSISNAKVLLTAEPDDASSRDSDLLLDPFVASDEDVQDDASSPEVEETLPVFDDMLDSDESMTKSDQENRQGEISVLSVVANAEESIAAEPAPDEDLMLDDLEEAILDELHEEAAIELEAAREEENDEDATRVDFLFELEIDQAVSKIEKYETGQARELFLRSLLQARLQYEKNARSLPSLLVAEVPAASSSTSLFEGQAAGVSTTANSRPNMEIFQRNLLKAQYKYKHSKTSKIQLSDIDSSLYLPNPALNGVPNERGPVCEGQKELFQRALLRSRIQNERLT